MNTKIKYLLDYPINQLELSDLIDYSIEGIKKKEQQVFACANPHSLVTAKNDPEFRRALEQSNHLVADGIGLAIVGNLIGANVGPRITGNDYFQNLLRELNDRAQESLGRKARVFFFGSSQRVLDLIETNMKCTFPNIELCGLISPPYGDWSEQENDEMVAKINDSRPDVLWVGMTAPKQEKWVNSNRHRLNATIIGSIGAVFDFFAGTHPRAPEWACKLGVEWIVRLVREPKRMWRRTIVSAPKFILMATKMHILRIQ